MAGITGYGTYIPIYRIKLSEIANIWQRDSNEVEEGLQIKEKSVPAIDEDAVTLAVEASTRAVHMANIQPNHIQSVYLGSESRPYVVNPSSSMVAEFLGIGNDYFAADLEFACKAATAGMQLTVGLLESKQIAYGLIIGSDTAQAKPQDMLEYTSASAACAYILGSKSAENIANILVMSSFTSNMPSFWRRDGAKFPSHAGRFTGEPAYFTHVISEGKKLLATSGLKPTDFSYCVFHMPNGKFPRAVAKRLGFTPEQLAPSLTVDHIGNPYTASSLVGLAAVLDIAKPHEKIFFVSYGSGDGSDGFIFQTTPLIEKKRKSMQTVAAQIAKKRYISYAQYIKQKHIL